MYDMENFIYLLSNSTMKSHFLHQFLTQDQPLSHSFISFWKSFLNFFSGPNLLQ